MARIINDPDQPAARRSNPAPKVGWTPATVVKAIQSSPELLKVIKDIADEAAAENLTRTIDMQNTITSMNARIDQVLATVQAGAHHPVRRAPEPNPLASHYRRLAEQTDDRVLRQGYEQLASEHDIRSVN